jgi:hypothetical protein
MRGEEITVARLEQFHGYKTREVASPERFLAHQAGDINQLAPIVRTIIRLVSV